MVSLKSTKRRSIGDRRITSDGKRDSQVRVTAAPSFRMGASLSLVLKTRARSETCTASTDGRANNFGCRPLSFPSLNQRIHRIPTAGQLPRLTARAGVRPGSAGVFCYDFDGKELWKTDLGEVRNEYGYGSSPILHRGKVILNFGPGERAFLTALDLKTGKLLWKYDEPGGPKTLLKGNWGSWCTPIVTRVGGKDQILCTMLTQLIACDPKTGVKLWFLDGFVDEKVALIYPSPVVCGEIGVAFTGWVNGPTFGFKLGGIGDVTASNRLWQERQTQRIGSGVVVEGLIYIVNAGPGPAQCMECRTGKTRWTERPDAGESWGSVVMAAGRLYVPSRRGG